MERRYFLKSTLAASLLESPKLQDDRTKKAVYVASGKNRVNELFGGAQPNLLKVSGKDTNGDLCIFEGYSTQKGGPPLHIHQASSKVSHRRRNFKSSSKRMEWRLSDRLWLLKRK